MRTLDDIIPPSRRPANEDPSPAPQRPLRVRSRSRFPWGTAIVAVVVIAGALAALLYFSTAEVDVTPNQSSVAASGSYTATASGVLPFEVITAEQSASQVVPATGTKQVNSSAQGTITISNTGTKSQTLIANTRFETPTGLIFRIHSSVSIPANGSKTATAYADQAGSTYNIGATSFTVPGLANTPQYTQVTAKSGAMSGGASGTVPVVDPAAAQAAESSLADSLNPALTSAIAAKVPDGYVLLAGAAASTFTAGTPQIASSSASSAQVSEVGTITAVVFPNAAIAKAIASANQQGYDGEPMTIQNPSSVTLTPAGPLPAASDQSFTFSLAGTADLLSTIDSTQIAAAVAGKTRQAAQVALTNFPAIKQAVLILRPFWESSFPADPSRIKVVIKGA